MTWVEGSVGRKGIEGEMARWKLTGRKTTNISGKKTSLSFSVSSSSLMLTFSSSAIQEVHCCVSCLCLTRGIMGVEVQSNQNGGFDGGMWLFAAAYSQSVGNTSVGFPQPASCYIKALFPSWAFLHFPAVFLTHSAERNKNKLSLIFPQWRLSLNRAAYLKCHKGVLSGKC